MVFWLRGAECRGGQQATQARAQSPQDRQSATCSNTRPVLSALLDSDESDVVQSVPERGCCCWLAGIRCVTGGRIASPMSDTKSILRIQSTSDLSSCLSSQADARDGTNCTKNRQLLSFCLSAIDAESRG